MVAFFRKSKDGKLWEHVFPSINSHQTVERFQSKINKTQLGTRVVQYLFNQKTNKKVVTARNLSISGCRKWLKLEQKYVP